MNDFLTHSAYISVFISLIAFYLGSKLFLKFHFPLFNPLLTAVLLVIGFLKVTGMDYKDYNEGASYINYLLTPSTICLAVPLYEQIKLLKKNYKAIFLGILSGVVTGLFAVYVLCLAFGFDHARLQLHATTTLFSSATVVRRVSNRLSSCRVMASATTVSLKTT